MVIIVNQLVSDSFYIMKMIREVSPSFLLVKEYIWYFKAYLSLNVPINRDLSQTKVCITDPYVWSHHLPVIRPISPLILALSLTGSSLVFFTDFFAKALFLISSHGRNSAAADCHRKWDEFDGVWNKPWKIIEIVRKFWKEGEREDEKIKKELSLSKCF